MLLADTFCYVLFTISVTATCVQSESKTQELSTRQIEKRITKREAAIIIDNFPIESPASKKPKVLYRRLSKQRYRAPKPRYGPPRPKYGPPPKVTRKPNKKYKIKKINPKYGAPTSKRSPKPGYPPTLPNKQNIRGKPKFGVTKKRPLKPPHKDITYQSMIQEPVGFGEPPSNYQAVSSNYEEPPVDSYGAPLKLNEPYPTAEESDNAYDVPEKNVAHDYSSWPDLVQPDNNFGYSNKYQTFIKPGLSVFDNDEEAGDEENLNTYSDVYKYNNLKKPYAQFPKKRPEVVGDYHKLVNRPWKAPGGKDKGQQILVGGQYAEPPARYVPKFQASAPMYLEDEENFNPGGSYVDAETPPTVSPYVNYKNSNMAFSPQNLNDAFSIIYKKR